MNNEFEYVFEVCSACEVLDIVNTNFNLGYNIFVACGGDGTLNNLINSVMELDLSIYENINITALPLGKANDFATNFNISVKIFESMMLSFNSRRIPMIKVNEKYFITGGCFGFSAKMIESKINLEKNKFHKFWFNLLGFNLYTVLSIYYLSKFKSLPKFNIDDETYSSVLMTTIMNQRYIGKKFYFAHKKNSDEYFEVRNINDVNSFSNRLKLMDSVMKKNCEYKSFKFEKVKFKFPCDVSFMGDGEILVSGKEFKFELVSKLNLLVNN